MPVRLSERSPEARIKKRWRKRGREIEYRDPAELVPNPHNPRTHSPEQLGQIGASFEDFGILGPVLIDGQNTIIAGHARVQVAIAKGITAISQPALVSSALAELSAAGPSRLAP